LPKTAWRAAVTSQSTACSSGALPDAAYAEQTITVLASHLPLIARPDIAAGMVLQAADHA
jgi:hypothetical protein